MLSHERETLRTVARNPGLFVGGAGVAVAWLVAQVVVGAPVVALTLPRDTQPVFALTLAGLVSVLVLPPALAGLYAAARRAREADDEDGERFGVGGSLPVLLRGSLRHGRNLVVATVWFRLAALVPAAVVLVVLFAGDTTVAYWRYAGGDYAPHWLGELVVAWLYVTAAGAVGRLVLAFYDLPVLFAGVSARKGWRFALRFTRRRPGALLRYAAGRTLLWLPMLAVVLLEVDVLLGQTAVGSPLASLATFVGAGLVVGTVTSTLVAAHHVVVYERTVEPVLREPTAVGSPCDHPTGDRPGSPGSLASGPASGVAGDVEGAAGGAGRDRLRVAALATAVLLVVAAAAGTGAVRLTDTRPLGTDARPVAEGASAEDVIRNAHAVLSNASYRGETHAYQVVPPDGDRETTIEQTVVVDRVTRRARLGGTLYSNDGEVLRTEYYVSEGTLAMNLPGNDTPSTTPLTERFVGRTAGEWGVMYVPGYRTIGGEYGTLPIDRTGVDWRVLERTDERIVVGYETSPDEPADDGVRSVAERGRLTVDPETGRPTRYAVNRTVVEYEDGEEVSRHWMVEEWTYGYDDVAVDRPDPIGSRGPVEWVWDIVYY